MADNGEDTNVRVAVRCRPFNGKEKANGEVSCVKVLSDKIILTNPSGNGEEHGFGFDLIIQEDATQESVWLKVGVPILNKALSGYNGTIFAYGQTGSGKTWSMQGASDNEDLAGIIPRMNLSLFDKIDHEKLRRPTIQFLITVSYFEIYNEVIFDLLDATDRKKKNSSAASKGGLEIKEHPVLGVYVKGLQEIVVDNAGKLQMIIGKCVVLRLDVLLKVVLGVLLRCCCCEHSLDVCLSFATCFKHRSRNAIAYSCKHTNECRLVPLTQCVYDHNSSERH